MFLAQASASGTGAIASMLIPLVIFFVLMYFMIMRPQKKEQQRVSSMLSSMEVGDSVVTTSGFYGTLIDITEEDVIVEFGNNKNCRSRKSKRWNRRKIKRKNKNRNKKTETDVTGF